eukprot:1703081-Amphidinium_carterae.1
MHRCKPQADLAQPVCRLICRLLALSARGFVHCPLFNLHVADKSKIGPECVPHSKMKQWGKQLKASSSSR